MPIGELRSCFKVFCMKRSSAPLPATHALQIDERLCFALYSASLAMTQVYKPLLAELRLTYPQFLVMMILWEHDGVSVKEIADRLRQNSAAVTPILKRLQAEGYVERGRDLRDERTLRVVLTTAGSELRARAAGASERFADFCGLNNVQSSALREALAELEARLRRGVVAP